jgi:ERCC4-type nuclease
MNYIDYREKKLVLFLQKKKILDQSMKREPLDFEVKKLESGDIIVGSFIIELKKGGDLAASIYDMRIFLQKQGMATSGLIPVLIIYDLENVYGRIVNRNVINGFLTSSALRGDIVIMVDRLEDIYYVLKRMVEIKDLSSHLEKKKSLIFTPAIRFKSIKERKIAALSCAESVGEVISTRIIDSLGTIEEVINDPEKVIKVKGVNKKRMDALTDLLTK